MHNTHTHIRTNKKHTHTYTYTQNIHTQKAAFPISGTLQCLSIGFYFGVILTKFITLRYDMDNFGCVVDVAVLFVVAAEKNRNIDKVED